MWPFSGPQKSNASKIGLQWFVTTVVCSMRKIYVKVGTVSHEKTAEPTDFIFFLLERKTLLTTFILMTCLVLTQYIWKVRVYIRVHKIP